MRSAARCISSRQPGTLIRIRTGGIQSRGGRGISYAPVLGSRADPMLVLGRQIAQGLTYLVGTSALGEMLALRHGSPRSRPASDA